MRMKTIAPALLAAVLAAGSAGAQERIDQRRPTGATGVVEIHNTAGNVRVVGWNRNEVAVTGTLGRGTERLDFGTEGDRVVVRVVLPRRGRDVRGSDIEVRVPARKTVNVRTVSAAIGVEGIAGAVTAHAVSGAVTVTGRPGEASLKSTSGEVRFDGQAQRVTIESVSGSVQVAGTVRDEVKASTVSADVRVTASAGEVNVNAVSGNVEIGSVNGRADVGTVSGDVRVTGRRLHGSFKTVTGNLVVSGDLARDGSTTFNTHSGNVELQVPRGSSAAVDVNTFSGDIETRVPDAQIDRRNSKELRLRVGRGDARISIRTFSGNVMLRGR